MKLKLLFITSLFMVSGLAIAHDTDQLGQLKGEHLGLFYTDHAISGHVKGRLVFASPFEKEFGLRMVHRIEGQDFPSEFKKVGTVLSGKVTGVNAEGVKSETEIKITKVLAQEGKMEGLLGSTPFSVRVSSKEMDGNHYVNPDFEVVLPNQTYRFQLENGKACMGCTTKIVYVVLGMLHSTGVL